MGNSALRGLSCGGIYFFNYIRKKQKELIVEKNNPELKNHLKLLRLFLEIRLSLALRNVLSERKNFAILPYI